MSIKRPDQNVTRYVWTLPVATLLIFALNVAMAYAFTPVLAGGFGVLPLFAGLCFLCTVVASAVGIWFVKLKWLELLGAAFLFSIVLILLTALGRYGTPMLVLIMIGAAFPGALFLPLCRWLVRLLQMVR